MQQLDPKRHFLYQLARVGATLVTLTGLAVLIGWVVDQPFLRGGFSPEGITVKTNAGIALLCCGLSLGLQCFSNSKTALRVAQGLAIVVLLLGGLTLSEHIFGWNLRIDQLLFKESAGQAATASPNRMGPPASICFVLSGLALLLLGRSEGGDSKRRDISTPLAAFVGFVGIMSTLGFLYGATALYGIARFTGISLATAVSFIILSVGIILAAPFSPAVSLIAAPTAGGVLVRRLLLPGLLLPPLLGYFRTFGEQAGWYDAALGRALVNTGFMIVLSTLVWTVGRALDHTDRARRSLLESERAARAEAERASRLKDEFLATLSHELRTPLTAILGWSQLLANRHHGPNDLAEGMETIARNARIQARIVEDLLDMSRIMTGKIPLVIAPMDLIIVIRAAIESVAPIAEAKSITINTSLEPAAGPFFGDAARLQQVMWNLLSNSIKFTARGGILGVFLRRSGGSAQIQVTDNGKGIRPDFMPHLFERFRQQDASTTRLHGGLGLGLSIAKQLVEFHGGTISAASEGEGKGATFTVDLPLPAAHPTTQTPIPGGLAPEPEKIDLNGLRVLVVDDEPDTRDIVSRLLKDCFADVFTADSADSAMALLRQRKPHVLVSDISMPNRDGYDLIHEIRDLPPEEGGRTPALALTAFARTEDRTKTMQAGYQAHMSKPIEPQELILTIAALAGKTRA